MRGKILTDEQRSIILENRDRWADDICKMDGMDGVTTRMVKDFLKRQEKKSDEQVVIETLETYIQKHGLPREYGSVLGYINYLKVH